MAKKKKAKRPKAAGSAKTIEVDSDAWDELLASVKGTENQPIVRAMYLMTKDLAKHVGEVSGRLESIEMAIHKTP